jgi:hypothetical protein
MRLPHVRLTIRWVMLLVAIVAVLLTGGELITRSRTQHEWRKWHQDLNAETTWVQSPMDEFYAKDPEDPFKMFTANSLLRVSAPGVPDRKGYYDRHRWWLGPRGELQHFRVTATGFGGKGGGAQHVLTAEELAQVQQIISALPPPTATSWQGDLLLVASLSEGSWVTSAYDKAAFPPAVQDLIRVLRLRFQ